MAQVIKSELHTLVSIEKTEMFGGDSRQMQRYYGRNYISNRKKVMNGNETNTSDTRSRPTRHGGMGWNEKYSITLSVITVVILLFIAVCCMYNAFHRQREDDQEEGDGDDIELGAKDNLSNEARRLFIASRLTAHKVEKIKNESVRTEMSSFDNSISTQETDPETLLKDVEVDSNENISCSSPRDCDYNSTGSLYSEYYIVMKKDVSEADKVKSKSKIKSSGGEDLVLDRIEDAEESHVYLTEFCPICWAPYKVGDEVCCSPNKDCSHIFHSHCIMTWLMKPSNDCPMCRCNYLNNIKNIEV